MIINKLNRAGKAIMFFSIILISTTVNGQGKVKKLYGGIEFAIPANQPLTSNKANGFIANIKGEKFFSKSFSGSVSIGYSLFKGKLIYWDGKKDNDFSLVPLMAGARYHFGKVYIGFEAGPAIAASKNTNTKIALAPAAGVIVNKFDVGLKFFTIPFTGGIPEKTFLQKGGYSYLGIRVAFNLIN